MNPEEITKDSLKTINIKKLALNRKFGALTFDQSYPLLEKLQKLFVEFEELGYRDNLLQSEISQIDQYIEQFLNFLRQLASFDFSTGFNKEQHDNFEISVKNCYDSVFSALKNMLVYLRQEASLKSQNARELQKQQRNTLQAEKEYKILAESLRKELQSLEKRKQEVEKTSGEVAAVSFGKHFESEAKENVKEAKSWLWRRDIFFWILLVIIIANVIGYFGIFIYNKINPSFIKPSDFFTVEYGLAKLALLAILSYGISFASRNFNVNSNLSTLNRHRKNVAETMKDFLQSGLEKEDRSKIVEKATDAMFKHQPIGYLPKIESKDDGPIASLVQNILRQ